LWSLVARRGIADPLVNEATPDKLHRVKQVADVVFVAALFTNTAIVGCI
jgi:hypothetical protein